MRSIKNISAIVFVIILSLSSFNSAFGQRKINIERADYIEYISTLGEVKRMIGNVMFEHDGAILLCDSAYWWDQENRIEAFSNVHIQKNDTLNLFGEYLVYNGNTKKGTVKEDVSLVDPQVTLTTEILHFDFNNNTVWYPDSGHIVSENNNLRSKKGFYYSDDKIFEFEEDVELENPEYFITTDTMKYNTNSEIAYFDGPTVIRSEENIIYCEMGWYDTKKDIASFWERAWLESKEYLLEGDSMYYDRNKEYGEIYGNGKITDTVNDFSMAGHYGEYYEATGYTFLTDSAYATMVDDNDTLFLHADTLYMTFDSLQEGKIFQAYHHAKYYKSDLQGMCDSLIYSFKDSLIKMYSLPVVWTDVNQITADSIYLLLKDSKLHRMYLYNNSFVISEDDSMKFNQIKGKMMTGYFVDNKLVKLLVETNSESIYFVRDDNEELVGINITVADKIRIDFEDSEVSGISFITKPTGKTVPEKDLPLSERFLKNFEWKVKHRPQSKEDIFVRTQ